MAFHFLRLTFFICLLSVCGFAQKKLVAYDCNKSIKINIQKNTTYGLTVAPNGFGEIQEFSSRLGDKKSFEKEHNSSWYSLNINYDGTLVFDIVPKDTTNDYDFLLFAYTDSAVCEKIISKSISPIRSNISRNKAETNSSTGLSVTSKNDFASSGIGPAYSNPIEVKKGEKYILVLDNVNDSAQGHRIYFNYLRFVEISGVVKNNDSIAQKAEITLTDNRGNVIAKTESDKNGAYNIKTKLKESTNYSLTYTNDSCFFETNIINTNTLGSKKSFENINAVLPKLKKGNKYRVGNINFFPSTDKVLPESYSSLVALHKLMKKNKKMIILIEGHVNAPGNINLTDALDAGLSRKRAEAIYNYLKNNGIDKNRISAVGLGATQMLFPYPSSEIQEKQNRRVEVKVISID